MAQLGDQSYAFGTSAQAPFMQVETLTRETTPEFEAEATDSTGNVASVVRGPGKITITASGYMLDAAPSHGDTITIDGTLCIFDKVSVTKSNKDFAKAEVSGFKYANVTNPL
jgi:hypothetical protein